MNFSHRTLILYFIVMQIACYGTHGAEAYWYVIATSNHYRNLRMTTETNFRQLTISKDTPKIWAHMDCAKICAADKKCMAFSFYEKETFYACDLAQDNYCTAQTGKALLSYNGSFVWDKINSSMTTGCYNPPPIPCENTRPGCDGFYPNCIGCIKTCRDCKNRYSYALYRNCTLWPDGDGLDSQPIVVLCNDIYTTLFHREVNYTTGVSVTDVRLSFEEMGRLLRANSKQYLRFVQRGYGGSSPQALYSVQAIEKNGTLTNVSFAGGDDIMKLSGRVVDSLKFVMVFFDTYGCGSFWLLDPLNATFCPGGPVRMYGIPVFDGTKLISSGIRYGDFYTNYIFVEAWLFLYPW